MANTRFIANSKQDIQFLLDLLRVRTKGLEDINRIAQRNGSLPMERDASDIAIIRVRSKQALQDPKETV